MVVTKKVQLSQIDLKWQFISTGLNLKALAERVTGHVVGGISPFGQRKRLPTVLDDRALNHAKVLVSAGRRGLQVELAPADLVSLTGVMTASVSREV